MDQWGFELGQVRGSYERWGSPHVHILSARREGDDANPTRRTPISSLTTSLGSFSSMDPPEWMHEVYVCPSDLPKRSFFADAIFAIISFELRETPR